MSDLELLRRFEPVVNYTQGEMFFPCAVDGYLERCSLWSRDAAGNETMLKASGTLDKETLAQIGNSPPGQSLFLRFVDKPLGPAALQQWQRRPDRPRFNSVGRLARVGLLARLVEAFYGFSLLVRGRVPGGTTAAAEIQYRQITAADPRYVYHGRVVRDGDYMVLHYLFFYAMNDWRSSFHGVNDHESDWEQIFIYLTESDDDFEPQWIAFAAHDFSGDDLRRRWDDPELQKQDESHPVVFAGAGSHASYVIPGEYLMQIEPELLTPLKRLIKPARQFFAEAFALDNSPVEDAVKKPLLSFGFVDYARGDGPSVGPDQDHSWNPEIISDDVPWVSNYRGLWGLDTHDPLGGERAPAGPKFDRDGTVRQSWRDPVGWSGLDKVPAPAHLITSIEGTLTELSSEIKAVWTEIEQERASLQKRGALVQALDATPDMKSRYEIALKELEQTEGEIKQLTGRYAQLKEDESTLRNYRDRVAAGDMGDPQAHIRHKAVPEPPPPRTAGLMDTWAAISGALFVIAFVLLVAFFPEHWFYWAILTVLVFGLIESALRHKLVNYLLSASFILATISAVVVLLDYWLILIPASLLTIFIYSLLTNLRELRERRHS